MKPTVVRLAILALLAALWPVSALAHGGGTPRLTNVEAGPYQLYVWSSPEPARVGEMHITIGVTQQGANGAETPADVAVQVVLTPTTSPTTSLAGGDAAAPVVRTATRGNTAADVYYEADVELPTAGAWQISVRAEGEAGVGEATYEQAVLATRRINIWLVVAVAAALLAAIGASRFASQPRTRAPIRGEV